MSSLRQLVSHRVLIFLLLAALLIWVEVAVTHNVGFGQYPIVLSIGVLVDLVFVTTGLFYWLVGKPLQLAPSRLLPIALLMLRVALFILPQGPDLSNQFWPFLLAFSEGILLLIVGLRIRTIIRTYRRLRLLTDAETALHGSLATVFGNKTAGFIIGEGLILYYVLLGWRLRSDIPVNTQILTTHRQSGQIALTIGLLMVGLIEGVAMHLLLTRWNPAVAFWGTALSIYALFFFVADLIATVKRPSYLTDTHLTLRLGVRWRATIPRSAIINNLYIQEKPSKQPNQVIGTFLTTPNSLLVFNEPILFTGPYGIQKQVKRFAFFADDREYFATLLSKPNA